MPEKKVVRPTTGNEKYPISSICWKIFLKYQGGLNAQKIAFPKKIKKFPIFVRKLINFFPVVPKISKKRLSKINYLIKKLIRANNFYVNDHP